MRSFNEETLQFVTKREFFVAQAMQGLLASGSHGNYPHSTAKTAVEFADAVLDLLNPKPEEAFKNIEIDDNVIEKLIQNSENVPDHELHRQCHCIGTYCLCD